MDEDKKMETEGFDDTITNGLEDAASTNLDDGELELGVPEEQEARQLNIGNIVAVIALAVLIIMGTIVIFSKSVKKRKSDYSELDKAGKKYVPELTIKQDRTFEEIDSINHEVQDEKTVEDILETLPPTFRPQPDPSPAPVAPVSSGRTSSSSRHDRPDTRNSKSPRKVEGIAGQDYAAQSNNNQNIVSAMMNGNGFSKEEYAEQVLSRSMALAGRQSYGNYSDTARTLSQQNQSDKEAFFNNGIGGNAGSGEYLSYGSLWEGTVISGALQTAINTDNPGLVIARVTENVYSSYDSSFLLIPEGTLLYATYNSSVSYGQKRVQVAWNLLIRPDGYRVRLGNMNGVSAQGASGYKGFANSHPFETLKALGLVALYSIIQTEMNEEVKTADNIYAQNMMNDTYSEVSKLGAKIVDRALDIKPTITIRQGTEIKLITNVALDLPPVKVNPVTRKYVRSN
ncbi:MAG: TrbI/VirB10 family protein [Treponema sp.]|nr:TrbI/VirB10 family protein [Treponema sp.]